MLTLMAAGLPNRKIAESLELSEKTVKNYVHGVLMKLNVTTRTEAASKALSELLVDPAECRRVRLMGTTETSCQPDAGAGIRPSGFAAQAP
ncbi:regulatory protein, luxR family [Lentzea xinjiangensis]|uniref:Regulatory protein, luxR family n=1 Tax=Lentzea xinjiangensis TaxID=402600 RepID=A0A1H9WS53_9PSEU|nr:regulatory protein, luxR family [Lentzea xinjiangensis]